LRLFAIPAKHQVYLDEFDHLNIAQNIARTNHLFNCINGDGSQCDNFFIPQWPAGFHVFLAMNLSVFGNSEQVPFLLTPIIASFTIILAFFLLFLIFKNPFLAIAGSFFLSLTPVHLKYSHSLSLDMFSLFWLFLTLIFLQIYLANKKFRSFLLLLAALVFFAQIRPEGFLLIPLIFLFLFKDKAFPRNNKFLWPALIIFLVLLIPLAQHIWQGTVKFPQTPWHDSIGQRLNSFKDYSTNNLSFFFNHAFSSIVVSLLAIVSLFNFKNGQRLKWVLFFLVFFTVFSAYRTGNFIDSLPGDDFIAIYGDASRYSLILLVPLTILAVGGLKLILERTTEGKIQKAILTSLVLTAFLMSIFPTRNFVFSKTKYDDGYDLLIMAKDKLPDNSLIITEAPAEIISVTGKRAIYTDIFKEKYGTHQPRDTQLILFKEYFLRPGDEKYLTDKFDSKLIEKLNDSAFYTLTPKN